MGLFIKRITVVGAAIAMLGGVACSSSSSSSSSAGSTAGGVSATEMDFSITLSSSTAPAGSVTFNITNNGPSTHEFVVIQTDDAPDALPVKNGTVDESGLTIVDENEAVVPGTTVPLSVDLKAGSYVIICNVSGHYQSGMHTGFTVS
jgi:uncharacterized cupredoxin-like copper-binding protein